MAPDLGLVRASPDLIVPAGGAAGEHAGGVLRAARDLLLDAFAPRRCAVCEAVGPPICRVCLARLAALPAPRRRVQRHGVAVAAFDFTDPVRQVLHRGKYRGDRVALEALTRLAAERCRPALRGAVPDAIVAVPLGARRRRRRGYNQAEVIARGIAEFAAVPQAAGLVRVRETPPQAERDEAQRRRNVAGAFRWEGSALAGAALWLVDDVLTTGATAEAAAAALAAAGAARVDVVVIAAVP